MKAITNFIFNPFHRIAGAQSLIGGIAGILITGLLAYYANSRFDGFLDFHFMNVSDNHWIYIFDGLIAWVIGCIFFYIGGRISSNTPFRLIDIIGTTALARLPLIIQPILVMVLGFQNTSFDQTAILEAVLQKNYENLQLPLLSLFLLGIFSIIFTIWYVILLYKAFVVSTNAKGGKAVTAFVCTIILAEILSIVILRSY